MISKLEEHGFKFARHLIGASEIDDLLSVLGSPPKTGRRGLLDAPLVAEIAGSEKLLELVGPYVGDKARAVRAIYFDKSADANWLVAWHQDLTLAVEERVDVAGFGPWSTKDGVPHVQAPVTYLETMLSLRIHFDDCDKKKGALRVLPGTHRLGRLSSGRIQELRAQVREVVCDAHVGDVMLMRPLLLHASGKSSAGGHRRVLHIEYAGFDLPGGLRWHAPG